MPKPLVKPVPLDISLEFHERLIGKVGKTLEDTKKRLCDTELVLNLEPNPDEKAQVKLWHQAVNEVLEQRPDMNFPTMRQIKREHDMKELANRENKSKKHNASKTDWNKKMNQAIEKQTENLQKMVLDKEGKFGGSVKGETLKTIQNYNGCNTIFKGSRTLIRKAGNGLIEENETSLPPWFHPQYYEIHYEAKKKTDTFYQLPFKALPRKKIISTAVIARENYLRRKEAVRLSASPPPTRDNMRAASFRDLPFDEDSLDGEEESSTGTKKERTVTIHVPEEENGRSSAQSREDSIDSSDSYNYYRYKDFPFEASKENSLHFDKQPESPKFIYLEEEERMSRQRSTTLKTKKNTPNMKLVPIKANHSYALKILATEEKTDSRWQVTDYTFSALASQPALVLDEFRLEETLVEGDNQSTDTPATVVQEEVKERRPKSGLKYSSEIFSTRPKLYKPPNDIIPDQTRSNPRTRTSSRSQASPYTAESTQSSPGSPHLGQSRAPTSGDDQNVQDDSSASTMAGGLMNSSLDLTRSHESITTIIDHWCRERGITASRTHRKPRVKHDDFLSRHPVLPSIETSLHGLLLESNPYNENDEIIKKNKNVDVDKIKV